jgi:ribosome-binding factor A
MKLFKTSLQKLMKYEKNTPEIVSLLKKAQRSFKFFEFMNKAKNRFVPSLIYKKSNDILKNMNKATGLYVKVENS